MVLDWLKNLDDKPDHPMYNLEEAGKLLGELPRNNPAKALEEVTSWLTSVKDTQGFRVDIRVAVVKLLDETGQPFQAEILRDYLSKPNLQNFQGLRQWQMVFGFHQQMADAYAVCVDEYARNGKGAAAVKEDVPVTVIRGMRGYSMQMKLLLMRYLHVKERLWQGLYKLHLFAESQQFVANPVRAYPNNPIRTTAQMELLKALMLEVSSPDTMAPDQIEITYRIAARLAASFELRDTPGGSATYYIDLSRPKPPELIEENMPVHAGQRFFGQGKALDKLGEIIKQNELSTINEEQRFGNEFTPGGKLTVLKHLITFWGPNPPRRRQERRGVTVPIDIIPGFMAISKLVTHTEVGNTADLTAEVAAMLKKKAGLNVEDEEFTVSPEVWTAFDVSAGGVGALVPHHAGTWIKIGALCGLKSQTGDAWWVGAIRRLQADNKNQIRAGIEILARKPVSVWLRVLGRGQERVSNWETSSGGFSYDYVHVILLPDRNQSFKNATILLESGRYASGEMYEVMMGEKSRNIQLGELLEQGEDFDRATITWLGVAA